MHQAIIEKHFQRLTSAVAYVAGPMWPSVLDVRTGRYPEGDHVPKRVYRLIGAPRGSTLYWDQPSLIAAYALSDATGNPAYAQAADAYVRAFLAECIAENGMFQWGNHVYYDVFERRVVHFANGHHELRPITPAWDVFMRLAPEATAVYIRTMADRHVYDPATGAFNRHDDSRRGHAFLEAGGILVESLAWLYRQTKDPLLLEKSLKIARFSYAHRHPETGLVKNEPLHGRWDSKVCTTEIGLWAQCLMRAAGYTANDEFMAMAREAVRAYLNHAYDPTSGRYAGQVRVDTGAAVAPEQTGYWPRETSDPWNTDQWPNHDYPMELAQACLSLYIETKEPLFLDAVNRWARIAVETAPARTGKWTYAENYGRCIQFLYRTGTLLHQPDLISASDTLAEEAVDKLYCDGMFLGATDGGHVYEAVDGVGVLLLALLRYPDPVAT